MIQIQSVLWHESGCTLQAKSFKSFRIKSLRRDAQEGIVYAKVDWL